MRSPGKCEGAGASRSGADGPSLWTGDSIFSIQSVRAVSNPVRLSTEAADRRAEILLMIRPDDTDEAASIQRAIAAGVVAEQPQATQRPVGDGGCSQQI